MKERSAADKAGSDIGQHEQATDAEDEATALIKLQRNGMSTDACPFSSTHLISAMQIPRLCASDGERIRDTIPRVALSLEERAIHSKAGAVSDQIRAAAHNSLVDEDVPAGRDGQQRVGAVEKDEPCMRSDPAGWPHIDDWKTMGTTI